MLNIYKASAGSGKTYKLAYEYIKALLGIKNDEKKTYVLNHPTYGVSGDSNNRHRYILAITFTNKATEEMKRRIVKELDSLTVIPAPGADDANYAKDLCKEFGCTRDELAQSAQTALRQLLDDYGSFSVTTIDSFFQRVLRTFARELDQQGDFSVELNDFLAVQTAVNAMLDEFNNNTAELKDLGDWIYGYMYRQLESGGKSNFFNRKSMLHNRLVSLVTRICDEKFKAHESRMEQFLSDPENLTRLKKKITERQAAIVREVQALTLSTLSYLEGHNAGLDKVSKTYKKLLRFFQENFIAGVAIDKDDLYGDSVSNDTIGKIIRGESHVYLKSANISAADEEALTNLLSEIRRHYADHYILSDIIDSLDQLSLLRYAWSYLKRLISDNNMVLLSDTNHLLSRIIGKDETPFIYERMGVTYRHYLIDEFQDTSRMQWDNLRPLVANGIGTGADSLIIGDEKQSIYRFRNSDSSLLHTQVANVDFADAHYKTKVSGSDPGENTNWRSAADIVRFNNTLFLYLTSVLDIEGYENVVQDISKRRLDLKGYIKFTPMAKPKKEASADSDDEPIDQQVLPMMAAEMRRQHNDGGYRWSDIAVLVATNRQGAAVVDYILTNCPDIPVISDEALYVRKSPAVQLIIGTLKLLADYRPQSEPDDTAARRRYPTAAEVAVVTSRFSYYIGKDVHVDDALNYAIDQDRAPQDMTLSNSIANIRDRKPSTLVALVETIIHELIPDEERAAQISYLNAFHDYLIDYCTRNVQSVRALLDHWETAKAKLTVSSATDVDAVKVMTIHKSKGLEFDCVHIPFGSWDLIGKPGGSWLAFPDMAGIEATECPPAVHIKMSHRYYAEPGNLFYDIYAKDEHDRLVDTMNMTYVAYTRAGRELMVYYCPEEGIGTNLSDIFLAAPATPPSDPRLCSIHQAYNSETSELIIGEPTTKEDSASPEAESPETIRVSTYDSYYHSGTNVLTHVDDMLDLDGDATADVPDDQEDKFELDTDARDKGIRLHEMLSMIQTVGDIDRAVSQVSLRRRLPLSERGEDKELLRRIINTDDPNIYRWFVDNNAVFTEQPIYLPAGSPYRKKCPKPGERDDYRRPDRIVINSDGSVDIVDYKFTFEPDRPGHKRQVRQYVSILKDMGYDRVSGYLWYPFLDKIVRVI